MATVFIPTLLRKHAGGAATASVPGATIREILNNLDSRYPGFKGHFVDPDDQDQLMPGIAAFVDGEASLLGLREPVAADSEVHLIPAVGGGSR